MDQNLDQKSPQEDFFDFVSILEECTYSSKMDTESKYPPVKTFVPDSDPINGFMIPKIPQSFATMS